MNSVSPFTSGPDDYSLLSLYINYNAFSINLGSVLPSTIPNLLKFQALQLQ